MTAREYYDASRQFRRMLALEWSLHASEFAYGSLYAWVGFFMLRRVGHSQVYDVIMPFLTVAGFLIYETWHVCGANAGRATAFYYFGLPRDRDIAFLAQLTLLSLLTVWLTLVILLGCALKLGGAGITAHYRIHPEMFVVPFIAMALTMAHVHLIRGWSYWRNSAALVLAVGVWFLGKLYLISVHPAFSGNDYWPEREMALWLQLSVAALLIGTLWGLIAHVRKHWHRRQIGAIR